MDRLSRKVQQSIGAIKGVGRKKSPTLGNPLPSRNQLFCFRCQVKLGKLLNRGTLCPLCRRKVCKKCLANRVPDLIIHPAVSTHDSSIQSTAFAEHFSVDPTYSSCPSVQFIPTLPDSMSSRPDSRHSLALPVHHNLRSISCDRLAPSSQLSSSSSISLHATSCISLERSVSSIRPSTLTSTPSRPPTLLQRAATLGNISDLKHVRNAPKSASARFAAAAGRKCNDLFRRGSATLAAGSLHLYRKTASIGRRSSSLSATTSYAGASDTAGSGIRHAATHHAATVPASDFPALRCNLKRLCDHCCRKM